MTPEEIQAMAKGLAEGQALWYVLSAVAGGAAAYLGAYKAEKGKNRATKEDIGSITHEVEKVRDEFSRGLADLQAHHQLRMIAAERRLQAHQDAYHYLSKLLGARNNSEEEWTESLQITNTWFIKNNFFLAAKSRSLFSDALFEFKVYRLGLERDQNFNDELNKHLKEVISVLQEEVALPPLGHRTLREEHATPL